MKRFFNILLGALAMLAVALLSAFITMRLAIHGREVKVPNLAGLSLSDASRMASSRGLRLNLENRFYAADTPPGHILAQSPAPGAIVRREWAVRVTESLGPQQVSIPNVVGESERAASVNIRRLALDLGTVARIASPGVVGIVLAQTPNPNAAGVDRPRVSLLLSQPEEAQAQSFVMPMLTGLTLAGAAARASAAGLHIVSAEEIAIPAAGTATLPGSTTPNSPTITNSPAAPATGVAPAASGTPPPIAGTSTGTVVAQTPLAGHRVAKGDAVHVSLTY
ncbi:MAG: domain containing protein [Edaphobacter sp.]|nr:domain containing protein [Edaphobacter sp.]